MNDDRQSDLFSDQRNMREPGDRCRCGHARVLHVSGGSGRCDFISCECARFRLELEPPRPTPAIPPPEPWPEPTAADQLAETLNKPEVPGFVRNSDTSRASAIGLYFKRPSQKRRFFNFIERQGDHGATCDEVEAATGIRHETVSGALRGLKILGVVVIDGERKRPTRRGCLAEVMIVPEDLRGIVEITAEDLKEPARPRRRSATPDPPYCDGRR